MNLYLNKAIADNYKSNTQKARVMTEYWVKENVYCPNCGRTLTEFENNRPVADFFCSGCKEEFELKAKNAHNIGKKIVDGAYSKMADRINSDKNPNFFFLTYNKTNHRVVNFLIIPKYYFIPDIIEKRKPLPVGARRAGWVGCNIKLSLIPELGKVYYVKNYTILPEPKVLDDWAKTNFLRKEKKESKGWIIDTLNCIDRIDKEVFELKDVYKFAPELRIKYPNNNHIEEKIRQQLQLFRDKGIIEFLGKGKYKKVFTP